MRCIQVAPLPCFTAMANPQSGFHVANVSDDEMVLVFAETGDPHIAERITRGYFFIKQLFLPFCATFSFGREKNMFHDVKRLSNFKTTYSGRCGRCEWTERCVNSANQWSQLIVPPKNVLHS